MKYFFIIGWAIFIDGLQAGISFLLAGFLGTIGGAVGAAYTCTKIIPAALQAKGIVEGCAAIGGVLGMFANPFLAPLGIMLGFVINICISLTMGAGLVLAIWHVCGGSALQKYIFPGFIADTIPGINNLPFWTALAITCSWQHAKQQGKLGMVGGVMGAALSPTRAIMGVKEATMNLPWVQETVEPQQKPSARPQNAEQLKQVASTRTPMQDVRFPQKSNVKTA